MFNLGSDFQLTYALDANTAETASIATRTPPIHITLGVQRWLYDNKKAMGNQKGNCFYGFKMTHQEYPHFANDSVIGTLTGLSVENEVLSLMCHEISHSVQQFYLFSKDWIDKNIYDIVAIVYQVFAILNKWKLGTMQIDDLKANLRGLITNRTDYNKIKPNVSIDNIVQIILDIGVTAKPHQDVIIAAVKKSNLIQNSVSTNTTVVRDALDKMGFDFNKKDDDIEGHGYLFQFIYKKVKEKHIASLKSNAVIIVEYTGRSSMKKNSNPLTFSEFVAIQEASSQKKRVAIDKFTQKEPELDQELIDQIKQLQSKEGVAVK